MNAIAQWFKSKGGYAHVMAAAFASLMLAYGAVPSFHSLVNQIHAALPGWLQELVTTGLALYAWYKTTSANKQPPNLSSKIPAILGFIAAHAILWRCLFLISLGVTMTMLLTGCAGVAFLTDLESIVPTALTGVSGILTILAPLLKHEDPAIAQLAATLESVGKAAQSDIITLNSLIAEYKQNGNEGTLVDIESLATTVSGNLAKMLETNGLPTAEAAQVQSVAKALTAQFEALISTLPVLKASTAGQTMTVTKPVNAVTFKAQVAGALKPPASS